MLDKLNEALQDYDQKWQKLIAGRTDHAFFEALKPTAVGWKTTDRAEYDRLLAELHDQADNVAEIWMNGRWVAKLHLKDVRLTNGVEIVKIMQRRPGSTDAVGLDHVDFYGPEVAQMERILTSEPGLKWSRENNDILAGYDWLSIWFDGTEAKLKHETVLQIVRAELAELDKRILAAQSKL
jgi:hypothetical protein